MRVRSLTVLPVVLALVALSTSGCFVMDELDSGAAEMGRYHGKPPDADGKAPKAKNPNTYRPPTVVSKESWKDKLPDVSEWWKKARTLNPTERDERIVACRLAGRDHFMDVNECKARGGSARS